jgi:hypothetical protein
MRAIAAALLVVAGCGARDTSPDAAAAMDAAGAEPEAAPDGLAGGCPAAGASVCDTGPRGAVVTSAGAGDCFAAPTTGSVWQVPAPDGGEAMAIFCGDITAVLGPGGAVDYQACGAETAINTSSCHQTGGGSAAPPAKLEWDFECTIAGGTCTTALLFLEHGFSD